MLSIWNSLTNGFRGFLLFAITVWISYLWALIRGPASWGKYFRSPIAAGVMSLAAMLFWGLIVDFVLPKRSDTSMWGPMLDMVMWAVALRLAWAWGTVAAKANYSGFAYRRGAVVKRMPRRASRNPEGITMAGISLHLDDETKHIKIIGTTGTGKSTAIREILTAALARGDRAIIADPDGGYLSRFYDADRGDVILNPFDGDAHRWHLFGEIINDYDVEQMARSLITDGGSSDRTWSEYARTLFSAVVHQCIVAGVRDDAELFRLLTKAPIEELRTLLTGTPAGPFLEPGNERMLGSIRSVLSSSVRALDYTTRQTGRPLSVRRWVKDAGGEGAAGRRGVLFIPYKAGEIAALRSLISAWMRIGIFEAMDGNEVDQRLWFVVDELDALGEIDGLKDALARLRKFGGRCILGFQSIAQVSGTYGRGAAETIVENCGNTLILRCSASERGGTSEFASKLIGMREVVHTTLSKSSVPDKIFRSVTESQNLRIEPAVMASEIERLPDLVGFLKLASGPDWQLVELKPATGPAQIRIRKPGVLAAGPPATVVAVDSSTPAVRAAPKPKRARSSKSSGLSRAGRSSVAAVESVPPELMVDRTIQSHPEEAK